MEVPRHTHLFGRIDVSLLSKFAPSLDSLSYICKSLLGICNSKAIGNGKKIFPSNIVKATIHTH